MGSTVTDPTPRAVRMVLAAVLAGLWLIGSGGPAAAHGPAAEQPEATNWVSEVVAGARPATGVEISVSAATGQVELVNRSQQVVTVMGYDGSPYLKVGPEGIFENRGSPSVALNHSSHGGGTHQTSDSADAASPRWVHVSADRTIGWHDHRTHWMGAGLPPEVDGARRPVLFRHWTIEVEVDGTLHPVRGELRWVPPPPLWPHGVLAVVTAVAAGLAARRLRGLVGVATGLAVAAVVGAAGTAATLPDPPGSAAVALVFPLLVLVYGLAAPRRRRGVVAAGAAAVTLAVFLTSHDLLVNSQLPTALPPTVARLTVTLATGLGTGLVISVLAEWFAASRVGRLRGEVSSPLPTPG